MSYSISIGNVEMRAVSYEDAADAGHVEIAAASIEHPDVPSFPGDVLRHYKRLCLKNR